MIQKMKNAWTKLRMMVTILYYVIQIARTRKKAAKLQKEQDKLLAKREKQNAQEAKQP